MRNRKLRQSFANAWTGVVESIQGERNLRIHVSVMILVVAAGIALSIDPVRWAVIFIAGGLVLVTELLNTAVERLVDMVTTDHCEEARQVKDMAAGAVLVAAFFAVLSGVAVFVDPIFRIIVK
jgi:undecaprenol kinase